MLFTAYRVAIVFGENAKARERMKTTGWLSIIIDACIDRDRQEKVIIYVTNKTGFHFYFFKL
jgi:hypothetical protein